MKIQNVKFVKSFAYAKDIPNLIAPEVAIVGRSNVGKSTFINSFTNTKIAKTSSVPGKTRLINYFDVNNGMFFLVDLPGYGYARVSKSEKQNWGEELEQYMTTSKNLKCILFLVDIRHKPTIQDLQMANYLNFYKIPYIVLATKSDKISKSQAENQKRIIAAELKLGIGNIIAISSTNKVGFDKIISTINTYL